MEFRGDLWLQKTRAPERLWRCLREHTFSRLVQYRRVTDGQTDGHTTTSYTALA